MFNTCLVALSEVPCSAALRRIIVSAIHGGAGQSLIHLYNGEKKKDLFHRWVNNLFQFVKYNSEQED